MKKRVIFLLKLSFILLITIILTFKEGISEPFSIKGIASWYSEGDTGVNSNTANMERFDDTKLTCAMWYVPFDTYLKVTNIRNGRYVIVKVNDRGPHKRLGRIIDLTKEAFARIEDLDVGIIEVSVEILK